MSWWSSISFLLLAFLANNRIGHYFFRPIRGGFTQSLFTFDTEIRGLRGIFSSLVLVIAITVFLWGGYYISDKFKREIFFFILLSFVTAILLLLIRDRLIGVFVGWEGLGITSFVLIIFYQNWLRAKGRLLTLITNRLGDTLLIIVFAFWISSRIIRLSMNLRGLTLLGLLAVAFTKSAQWPFVNWLPAAIAAPTPVRALVHSSTLVTAGVWLLLRFKQLIWFRRGIWGSLGLLTLFLASLAAFLERDAKKVVALSTLRQLGLIVLSLRIGGVLVCLFHVLAHALAKANLFLVVGNHLHSGFSQQDIRKMSLSGGSYFTVFALFVRVISLSGLLFIRGFYSKEQIIGLIICSSSSRTSYLSLTAISSITLGYCLKLFIGLCRHQSTLFLKAKVNFFKEGTPVIILRGLRLIFGYIYHNFALIRYLILTSVVGVYWTFLGLAFLGLAFTKAIRNKSLLGFNLNDLLVREIGYLTSKLKTRIKPLEFTLVEPVYRRLFTLRYKLRATNGRAILIGTFLLIVALII